MWSFPFGQIKINLFRVFAKKILGGKQMNQNEIDRRKAIRQKELKKRKRKRYFFCKCMRILSCTFIVFVFLGIIYFFLSNNKVEKEVQLEAGEEISIQKFLIKENLDAEFITDLSSINVSKIGTYPIEIAIGEKRYHSNLIVKDTIAPKAEVRNLTVFRENVPEPEDFIIELIDATQVTVSYEKTPDVSKDGESKGKISLTDEGGNQTIIDIVVTVESDNEPPVIEGVEDISIFIGDSISYRDGITVTDNIDPAPSLEIDNSLVDINQVGKYEVKYIATDSAGNQTESISTLTIKEKPNGYVEQDEVYKLASPIYEKIINDDMTEMQKAFEIYKWVKQNIGYTGFSDKSCWERGAYDAFKYKAGDCYNYFAAAKALYNLAGIENIDIVKSDTSHSSHYWSIINIGDGWYHVDCTPRKGEGDNFFMVTDAELESYSKLHKNSHIFDTSIYPERETESLQNMVDYVNMRLK